ncbi:MAG TPA: hypothetical protein VF591_05355 [Pyrinomonadaceae bacterium]|jgi:hypothetical protein
MGLAAWLARLEEKAARVIRCAWCRVSLIDDHQQKARGRTVTTDYVMRSCVFCGNEFKVGLEGLTPRERESLMLWAYTYNGETYRDERAYAAREWWMCRAWVRVFTEPEHRRALTARQQQKAAKPDAYARERAELKEEADRLTKAEERRQRREYGPRTFPLVATLRALKAELKDLDVRPYTTGYGRPSAAEKLARQVLVYARCMAACELVVWDAVDEMTAAMIEARAAEVTAFEDARAEKEREEAERLREAAEQRATREGERAAGDGFGDAPVRTPPADRDERMREIITQHSTFDAPVPRFRKDPSAAVPRNPTVFDPEAAHVPDAPGVTGNSIPVANFYDPNHPDAVQFQRSMPADPMRGLTIDDLDAERARGDAARRYYRGEYYDGDRRY